MLLKCSQQTTQIKTTELQKVSKTLQPYIKHLQAISAHMAYQIPESLINTPFDEQAFGNCWQLKEKLVSSKLKYIYVVGIGGSILATKGIYTALGQKPSGPKIVFVEYLDVLAKKCVDETFKKIETKEEYLLLVISKTGKTYEVSAAYDYFKQKHDNLDQRTVIITDKNSSLWRTANEKNIELLQIPDPVPGRFTAFTAVTVFPLLCAGFDVLAFAEGGMKARTDCLSKEFFPDFVATSFLEMQNKKSIFNLFSLDTRLMDFGFWFKQIYAESLGKEFNLKSKQVFAGVTPIYTQAPGDYHSQLQLYLGGPNDKFTFFITTDSLQPDMFLKKSFEIIKQKYQAKNRPFIELQLEKLNEYELGYLMLLLMTNIILLGALLGINSFDQPEITDIKNELI